MKPIESPAVLLAQFIKTHIIRVTEKAFDDFAAGGDTSVPLRTQDLA